MNDNTPLTNESTRPGETLTTMLVQRDSSGYVISRTTIEHFGMTNAVANELNLALTQGMVNSVQALAEHKAANESSLTA